MQFGLYLKNKGVITAEQLVAALEVQQLKMVPLGQLAMEEGILTARQVFTVLCSQSDTPHERFGDAAIDLGLMTRDQLLRLLVIQLDRKLSLVEILIRQRTISRAQANAALAVFRCEMERRGRVIKRPIYATPRKSLAASVKDSLPDGQFATGS